MSALDGSSDVRLDLPGIAPEEAGYAGEATIDRQRWLYFVSQLTPATEGTDRPTAEFALVRTPVGANAVEEVMRFTSRSGGGRGRASISPDGAQALIATPPDELVLIDLASGARSLIVKGTCGDPAVGKCSGYISPQWSPAGGAMIVKHAHYEGANAAFASPISAEGVTDFPEYGGEFQAWAPDGSSFCTQSSTFSPGGTWIVERATLAAENLELRFPDSRLDGCWVNQRGEIAVMTRPASGASMLNVEVIGEQATSVVRTSSRNEYWHIRGWLPDGSGLLAHRSVSCWLCNDGEPLIGILALDGSMHRFAFDVASQRTLGAEVGVLILGTVAE